MKNAGNCKIGKNRPCLFTEISVLLGFWLGLVPANIDGFVDLLPTIIKAETQNLQQTSPAQAL